MNPVKARIVDRPEEYSWSSDRFFRSPAIPGFEDRDAALALLGPTRGTALCAYAALMDDATLDYGKLDEICDVVKGDEEFALGRLTRSSPFQPALRGLSIEHLLDLVA